MHGPTGNAVSLFCTARSSWWCLPSTSKLTWQHQPPAFSRHVSWLCCAEEYTPQIHGHPEPQNVSYFGSLLVVKLRSRWGHTRLAWTPNLIWLVSLYEEDKTYTGEKGHVMMMQTGAMKPQTKEHQGAPRSGSIHQLGGRHGTDSPSFPAELTCQQLDFRLLGIQTTDSCCFKLPSLW